MALASMKEKAPKFNKGKCHAGRTFICETPFAQYDYAFLLQHCMAKFNAQAGLMIETIRASGQLLKGSFFALTEI